MTTENISFHHADFLSNSVDHRQSEKGTLLNSTLHLRQTITSHMYDRNSAYITLMTFAQAKPCELTGF